MLSQLGYQRPRTLAIHALQSGAVDHDLLKELHSAPVLVCANTDIARQLENYYDGRFTKGKIVVDLKMSEHDHALSGQGHVPAQAENFRDLEHRITEQLKQLGF